MLMVIFGAGASYGSVDLALGPGPAQNAEATRLDGLRPPLTAELLSPRFGEFAAKYPGSVPAIVQLQHAIAGRPDPAIEAAIGDLSSLAASDNEVARHMLALRFYLSDLIETTADNWWQENHGISHYSRLLARIGVWRNAIGEPVALVTFNYDTLLDRSLDSQLAVGRKRAHWNDYVDRPDWRLYKLHGSTAWSRVLSTSGRAGSSTDPASVIARAESLNILGAELRDAHWASGDVAVPGIAVPTDRKQTFECPSHHRRRFHDDVKVVDRLLIVGWRGAEPHALEILADVSPGYRLAIADVDDASIAAVGATLGQIAAKSPKPVGIAGGFTGLLDGDVLEDWLALEAPGGWNE